MTIAQKIIITIVRLYQVGLSPMLKNILGIQKMCRFTPSCSHYTAQMVKKHGVVRGVLLGGKQLLCCR